MLNLEASSGSWELQRFCASMIEEFAVAGWIDRMLERIGQLKGFPIHEVHGDRNDDYPAYLYAEAGGMTFLFIEGCSRVKQALNLVAGYGLSQTLPDLPGANAYLTNAARRIWDAGDAIGLRPTSRVIMTGHSLGGSQALAFHGLCCRRLFGTNRTTITFGSPRTGQSEFTSFMAGEDITRVMNSLDPVPLIPPQADQATLCQLAIPSSSLVNWNRYVHVQGGLAYRPDGTRYATELTSDQLFSPQLSLAQWLYSLPAGTVTIHSMPSYISTIEYYGSFAGPADPPAAPPAPRETHSPVTETRVNEVKRDTERSVIGNSAIKAAATIEIPDFYKFRTMRTGKQYFVIWCGATVAIGPQRKKAKELARRGNNFLTQWLRQGDNDEYSLSNAVLAFLLASQDASSGIKPVQ